MIQIIFSVVIIAVVGFVYVLDGDMSKIPFLNKSTKPKGNIKQEASVSNKNSKIKQTQRRLPIKSINSSGGIDDKALIIKSDGSTYVGVIEVYGVNYNLLSVSEKLLLEEVFQMVLNGLDYPIQLFVQSKTMDIDNYNYIYENRINELKELQALEVSKRNFLGEQEGKSEEMKEAEGNIRRLENQINYGLNVIKFINDIAYNSDILDKKYYIAVSYKYDTGLFSHEQTESEKFTTAFNTLNNRIESILSGLGRGNLQGKFLNGVELAELLYTSFNKHDSSDYKVVNAINSGFSNYIVTSRPVEHKIIDNEEKELIELAKSINN